MTSRKTQAKKPKIRVHPICKGETRTISWFHHPDTIAGTGTAKTPEIGDHVWSRVRSGRVAMYEVTKVLAGKDGFNYFARVKWLSYRGENQDDIHAL